MWIKVSQSLLKTDVLAEGRGVEGGGEGKFFFNFFFSGKETYAFLRYQSDRPQAVLARLRTAHWLLPLSSSLERGKNKPRGWNSQDQ